MVLERLVCGLALAILLAGADGAAKGADISFSEQTFLDGNWTAWKVLDGTPAGDAVFTAQQALTGGASGAYRRTQFTFNYVEGFGQQSVAAVYLLSGAVYNPGVTGAIATVSFSEDALIGSRAGGSPWYYSGPVLAQDGVYYAPDFGQGGKSVNIGTWEHIVLSDLRADSFIPIGGSASIHPDFSAAGNAIQIGYYTASGAAIGPTSTIAFDTGLDNFHITITSVPEPASLALLAVGGVMLLRRRRGIGGRIRG